MRFSFPAAVAALLCLPVAVPAQSLVTFDLVGPWQVMVDPSVSNGCLINAVFEDGSDVRIGFDPDQGGGYLLAMNDAWGDIVEGEVYPIAMDVDGVVYEGEGVGLYLDGMPGVDILFDNVDFLMDVAARQTLTLINESGPVMSIDLSYSLAALESAMVCQQVQ